MTEDEWLHAAEPEAMLAHLGTRITFRRAVLLGVACRRRVAAWDVFDESQIATDVAERWADGLIDEAKRRTAYISVLDKRDFTGRALMSDPDSPEPNKGTAYYYAVEAATDLIDSVSPERLVDNVLRGCRDAVWHGDFSPDREAAKIESAFQSALIRDIFGNRFRPVAFDPSWRTSTVVALAQQMYASRDFSPTPVLADALQDAGCENEAIIAHCRGDGPHVRGCCVVDLVLGKE